MRTVYVQKNRFFIVIIFIIFYLLFLQPYGWVFADNEKNDTEINFQLKNLNTSIDQAVLREQEELKKVGEELKILKEQGRVYTSELSSLKVQFSVYSNLVIMPGIQIKNLEQAFSGILSVQATINKILPELKEKKIRIKSNLDQTEEQIQLNTDQQKEITTNKKKPQTDADIIAGKLKELLLLLKKKKESLTRLSTIYEDYFLRYSEVGKQFSSLSATLEQEIKSRKRQHLFQRKKNILFTKNRVEMASDIKSLLMFPKQFSFSSIQEIFGTNGSSDYSGLVISILLLLFLQYILMRARKRMITLKTRHFYETSRWWKITCSMLKRSIFLGGNTLFLILYDSLFHIRFKYPMIDVLVQFMVVILLTRWVLDFFRLYPASEQGLPSAELLGRSRWIVRLIRYFSIIHITGIFLVGSENIILPGIRIIFILFLYIELYIFRKKMSEALALSSLSSRMKNTARSLHTGAYLFLFTYFLADLYGFSQLAIYAFSALAKTFLVLMWSGLFLKILIEFKSTIHFEAEKNKNDLGTTTLNRNWFFTLVSALIWLLLSLLGLIYIWGGKHAVIQGAYAFYVTPVTVGTMQFSLKKVCVAVLMLMITHIAAKVWRDLFQKKLLSDSGMDIGVQESVTTISVYLIWTVGILMALNVFGLNMTSITVVLGALGIGIGFGLQNIFNNFLSGIILLFERPIQVGDDVEVNGTWANVKKINVRSTVVQTYDNATLIIPNSDFISTQVTNWSFKDKRIRRNITVGVAYGSDTGLVHSSLLEAADKTMRVLKYPNPDVVFKDFGDNSLVFILRFWTRVEYFYAVESDVRFEIDRLFRERGIEISFPQRDIHIRSFDQAAVVRHTQIDNSPKQISGEDHSPKEIVSEKE